LLIAYTVDDNVNVSGIWKVFKLESLSATIKEFTPAKSDFVNSTC
jgi:hypothetical protein